MSDCSVFHTVEASPREGFLNLRFITGLCKRLHHENSISSLSF